MGQVKYACNRGCAVTSTTATEGAATPCPMTVDERAETLVAQLMDCDGGCEVEKGNYCPGGEDLWEHCKADRVIIASAIRAAEVAKVNEKLEELAVQDDRAVAFAEERMRHTNENDEYYYTLRADAQRFRNAASHVRSLKLPSPSPEKKVVGGRESKPARSDTDATGEAPDG